MAFRSLVLLTVILLCSLGCPKRVAVFGPEGEITEANALLKRLHEAEAKVLTLQGEAKLRVDSPQGSGALGLYVSVSRPSLLHLETMDFFGKVQAVLTCKGDRFGLYQVGENRYYQGPATAENLSRFLPVTLPPNELTVLMLGQVPQIPHDQSTLTVDTERAAYKLVLTRGEVTQTLWVDTQSFRPLKSEVRGTRAYDLTLEDQDELNGVTFMRHITLVAAGAKTTLDLRYKDVTVNDPPDLTLFDLTAPPGVPVVNVDGRGREIVGT